MALSKDARQSLHDQAYMEGSRAAWTRILADAVRQLGYQSPTVETLLMEREAVVALLRSACDDFGDNDWPEDGHLADVIEKHLLNHLSAKHRRQEDVMPRFFFYDPNAGMQYFATQEACLDAARQAIRLYRQESDGTWPEDALAELRMGILTHTAQQTHVLQKPPDADLDEEGYDEDGNEWAEYAYYCDYEMLPVKDVCTKEV